MKVEQNISRLIYLLELYKLTVNEFIELVNKGVKKRKAKKEDLFSTEIKLSFLKKFDKIFNKGIHFYLDPEEPPTNKQEASIFFRKSNFETELNLGSKIIVDKFEERKNYFSGLSKLADVNVDRQLPTYTIDQDPAKVAAELRLKLYPSFTPVLRDFLKNLISKFSEFNILVYEFVEAHNLTNKTNIDGFYLYPNTIVIKRQQRSFRREIFTLVHELGHYLLKEEEVEELNLSQLANPNVSRVERWCNDFAYHFLIGDFAKSIDTLTPATASNDYHHSLMDEISRRTNISRIALYTRLLILNKVSYPTYRKIDAEFKREADEKREKEKALRELAPKDDKQKGSQPQPIISPLLESVYKAALYEGVINEYEFCKTLNISPDKLPKYLD